MAFPQTAMRPKASEQPCLTSRNLLALLSSGSPSAGDRTQAASLGREEVAGIQRQELWLRVPDVADRPGSEGEEQSGQWSQEP